MILYFLRHAEAEPKSGSGDSGRKLTATGRTQAERVGQFCKTHKIKPELVLTSPFCRAVETMDPLLKKVEMPPFLNVAWLSSGMTPEIALEELQAYRALKSVMLVGHEPDFSCLIATLLGLPHPENLNIAKASLTAIHLGKIAPRAGVLQFLIPEELAGEK